MVPDSRVDAQQPVVETAGCSPFRGYQVQRGRRSRSLLPAVCPDTATFGTCVTIDRVTVGTGIVESIGHFDDRIHTP